MFLGEPPLPTENPAHGISWTPSPLMRTQAKGPAGGHLGGQGPAAGLPRGNGGSILHRPQHCVLPSVLLSWFKHLAPGAQLTRPGLTTDGRHGSVDTVWSCVTRSSRLIFHGLHPQPGPHAPLSAFLPASTVRSVTTPCCDFHPHRHTDTLQPAASCQPPLPC